MQGDGVVARGAAVPEAGVSDSTQIYFAPLPKPDGGSAFPTSASPFANCGMSLRDWFAGQALAGILADHEYNPAPDVIAEDAYDIADAMIARRSK